MLGIVAVVAVGGPTLAADLPVKAPPIVPTIYNWSGCYIGGNVGGGWARVSQEQVANVGGPAINPPNDFGASRGSSFVGGGQIGCDYRFAGGWVVGVQAMFDFAKINSSHIEPTAFPGFPIGSFISQNHAKNVFTATGRVGYLFAPQVLGYLKGGLAWTQVDQEFIGTVPRTFLSESVSNVNLTGWTIGGGVEWMFAPGWSAFGEFNYMDFGRRDISFVAGPGTVGAPDVVRTRYTIETALVGVNYKFNWGGPIVARY